MDGIGIRFQRHSRLGANLPPICLLLLAMIAPAQATTFFVSQQSTNPLPPFATWDTAATNIQDAVNLTHSGDTVLVTDGVYKGGISLGWNKTATVVVTNAILLQSINGPLFTAIRGDICIPQG